MPDDGIVDSKHRPDSVEGPVITGFTNVDLEESAARKFQAWQMDFSAQTKMSL